MADDDDDISDADDDGSRGLERRRSSWRLDDGLVIIAMAAAEVARTYSETRFAPLSRQARLCSQFACEQPCLALDFGDTLHVGRLRLPC